MPPITRPAVRLLYLASQLGELRKQAGLAPKDVCAHLGISAATFSRIENAAQLITPGRVEELLELYGAPMATRAELIRVAKEASKHGLWQGEQDVWKSGYVNLERDADRIFVFELAFAPGLLQTAEYYRALIRAMASEPEEPDEIEQRVASRIGRQSLMTRDNAPRLHAVIGETALRQMVGSPEVMRGQLLALADATDLPNVTLQVVPFAAGAYPGLDGGFSILTFNQFDMQIGFTEGPAGHIYLESAAHLKGINVRREGVLKAALSPSASADFLREAAAART